MTESRKGELLIALEGILWAFFPVITALSYSSLPALISLAWGSLFAGVFFGAIVAYRGKWYELANKNFWKYVSWVVFFTGFLYYVFYFIGLEYTTPGNASIIALFEVFTSYLFFNVFRGEEFSREHIFGSALIVIGALIIIGKNSSGVNAGDILILAAASVAPFGNYFQRKARHIASSETILFARSIAAAVLVFLLAFVLRVHATSADVTASIGFLLINGILLLGLSKFLWIEAIHRISVAKANALNGVTPLLTLFIAWALLGQQPNFWQLTSLVPMIFGVLLLTNQLNFQTIKRSA